MEATSSKALHSSQQHLPAPPPSGRRPGSRRPRQAPWQPAAPCIHERSFAPATPAAVCVDRAVAVVPRTSTHQLEPPGQLAGAHGAGTEEREAASALILTQFDADPRQGGATWRLLPSLEALLQRSGHPAGTEEEHGVDTQAGRETVNGDLHGSTSGAAPAPGKLRVARTRQRSSEAGSPSPQQPQDVQGPPPDLPTATQSHIDSAASTGAVEQQQQQQPRRQGRPRRQPQSPEAGGSAATTGALAPPTSSASPPPAPTPHPPISPQSASVAVSSYATPAAHRRSSRRRETASPRRSLRAPSASLLDPVTATTRTGASSSPSPDSDTASDPWYPFPDGQAMPMALPEHLSLNPSRWPPASVPGSTERASGTSPAPQQQYHHDAASSSHSSPDAAPQTGYSPRLAAVAAAVLAGTDYQSIDEVLVPLEDMVQLQARHEGARSVRLRALSRPQELVLTRLHRDGLGILQARRTLRRVLKRQPTQQEMARAMREHPADVAQRWKWGVRAKQVLLAYNKGLVHRQSLTITRGMRTGDLAGLSRNDVVEEGTRGLMHALDKFDPEAGNTLSTYAVPWIQLYMRRGIVDQAPLIRIPSTLFDDVHRFNHYVWEATWGVRQSVGQHGASLPAPPSDEEVARALGWSLVHVRSVRRAAQFAAMSLEPASLNRNRSGQDNAEEDIGATADLQPLDGATFKMDVPAPDMQTAAGSSAATQQQQQHGEGTGREALSQVKVGGRRGVQHAFSSGSRTGPASAMVGTSADEWLLSESVASVVDAAIVDVLLRLVQRRTRQQVTAAMVEPLVAEVRRLLDLPSSAWGKKLPQMLRVMPEGWKEGAAKVRPAVLLPWNSPMRTQVRREVMAVLQARLGAEELSGMAQMCGLGSIDPALAPRSVGGGVRKAA